MSEGSDDAVVNDASDSHNDDDVIDNAVDSAAVSGKSYLDLAEDKNAQAGESFQLATNTSDADQKNQLVEQANDYSKQSDVILSNGSTIDQAWNSIKLWANNFFLGTNIGVSHQTDSQVHSEQQVYNWAYDVARGASRAEISRVLFLLSKDSTRNLPSNLMKRKALLDVYYGRARNPPGQAQPEQERVIPAGSQAVGSTAAPNQLDSQQWEDFYIQTRRYATKLTWQQLNDQFYQQAVAAEAHSPTLTTQLRLKAYVHELNARTRKGKAS